MGASSRNSTLFLSQCNKWSVTKSKRRASSLSRPASAPPAVALQLFESEKRAPQNDSSTLTIIQELDGKNQIPLSDLSAVPTNPPSPSNRALRDVLTAKYRRQHPGNEASRSSSPSRARSESSRRRGVVKFPSRPNNAFFLFRADMIRKPDLQGFTQSQLSGILAELWSKEREEVKLHYRKKAEIEKQLYLQKQREMKNSAADSNFDLLDASLAVSYPSPPSDDITDLPHIPSYTWESISPPVASYTDLLNSNYGNLEFSEGPWFLNSGDLPSPDSQGQADSPLEIGWLMPDNYTQLQYQYLTQTPLDLQFQSSNSPPSLWHNESPNTAFG
ncbi:hypothetical protein NEOLI_003666 [Neolecta irregularis DAH-3]|uniref:HMG box domain-containing protein n=1 Tax=Neolecta irregularis (strain DAH-3) TaxID=1198029 RepID=A0A1U7LHY1_NEOID|nr:hypothetical protein NEOLI_003666 [Neolecta irregularis DAH-3]|eukprot:OLL22254.1 hypothetical protein NEOLI_003666 [Neolecta irregularis DAH-3]